ncbi:uncharacterized protein [Battus philenor]|uniref:uncharacterized protein n=1 Tax=Battus philenor TaxID=42288 RepID=UPI0035D0884A
MDEIQNHPLKIYIQDIFRAKNSVNNKYVYEIFGIKMKNVMIHGIITAVYNRTSNAIIIELTDATASVQVYYDSIKSSTNINEETIEDLNKELSKASINKDDNAVIMFSVLDMITKKKDNALNFEEGDYVSLVGDIFVDETRNQRMISAYEFRHSSVERDLVWMEELRYLYEKFYLWNKITEKNIPSEVT